MTTGESMSTVDRAWLLMERPTNPMVVMGLLVLGRPLRRVGLQDTFAEGAQSAASLFRRYGLGTQDIVDRAWSVLQRPGTSPPATAVDAPAGAYSPV